MKGLKSRDTWTEAEPKENIETCKKNIILSSKLLKLIFIMWFCVLTGPLR